MGKQHHLYHVNMKAIIWTGLIMLMLNSCNSANRSKNEHEIETKVKQAYEGLGQLYELLDPHKLDSLNALYKSLDKQIYNDSINKADSQLVSNLTKYKRGLRNYFLAINGFNSEIFTLEENLALLKDSMDNNNIADSSFKNRLKLELFLINDITERIKENNQKVDSIIMLIEASKIDKNF